MAPFPKISELPQLPLDVEALGQDHTAIRNIPTADYLYAQTVSLTGESLISVSDEESAAGERAALIVEWLDKNRKDPAVNAILDKIENIQFVLDETIGKELQEDQIKRQYVELQKKLSKQQENPPELTLEALAKMLLGALGKQAKATALDELRVLSAADKLDLPHAKKLVQEFIEVHASIKNSMKDRVSALQTILDRPSKHSGLTHREALEIERGLDAMLKRDAKDHDAVAGPWNTHEEQGKAILQQSAAALRQYLDIEMADDGRPKSAHRHFVDRRGWARINAGWPEGTIRPGDKQGPPSR